MSLQKANERKAATIIKNLKKRNIQGVYCATKKDALKQALSYIEKGSVVSWGGSESIIELGLMDAVTSGDYKIIDRSAVISWIHNYDFSVVQCQERYK